MSLHDLADMAKSIADKLVASADHKAMVMNQPRERSSMIGEIRDGNADAVADLAKLVQELAREVACLAEPVQ